MYNGYIRNANIILDNIGITATANGEGVSVKKFYERARSNN